MKDLALLAPILAILVAWAILGVAWRRHRSGETKTWLERARYPFTILAPERQSA